MNRATAALTSIILALLSVVATGQSPQPATRPAGRAAPLLVAGKGFELAPLGNDEKAFRNRNYVWTQVPAEFAKWSITRISGGSEDYLVNAVSKTAGRVYIAMSQELRVPAGWQEHGTAGFNYNDKHATRLAIHFKDVPASETLVLPRTQNWAGVLLLVPPGSEPAKTVAVSDREEVARPWERRSVRIINKELDQPIGIVNRNRGNPGILGIKVPASGDLWRIIGTGSDRVRIGNVMSGLCLGVRASSTEPGEDVIQWAPADRPVPDEPQDNEWVVEPAEGDFVRFRNAKTKLYLHALRKDQKAQTVQEVRRDSALQLWKIESRNEEPVDPPAPAPVPAKAPVGEVVRIGKLESKRPPEVTDPKGLTFFQAPNTDQWWTGSNGVLFTAAAGWETAGTVWQCGEFSPRPWGMRLVHPYGDGHLVVHIGEEGIDLRGGGPWKGKENAIAVRVTPEFAGAFPLSQDVPHTVHSELSDKGEFSLQIDGKLAATAKVDKASPLTLTGGFVGEGVPRELSRGQAAVIVDNSFKKFTTAGDLMFGLMGKAEAAPPRGATTLPMPVPPEGNLFDFEKPKK